METSAASRKATPSTTRQPTTRLARFIYAEKISVSKLSRTADVNLSHLFTLKAGESEPTRFVMEKLRRAAAELLGRDVSVLEMFSFGE